MNVALRNFRTEALGTKGHSDHQKEAQRQHHNARMGIDEVGEWGRREQHHRHGDKDRDHHDRNMIGNANGGNDAVDREYSVQQEDWAIAAAKVMVA